MRFSYVLLATLLLVIPRRRRDKLRGFPMSKVCNREAR